MTDTHPLNQLPELGRATAKKLSNGQIMIRSNHALAMLRLIEKEAGLEIKVSQGEQEILLNWPKKNFKWIIAGNDQDQWATAAVELLKQGPPKPRPFWVFALIIIAVLAFLTTVWLLDFVNKTHLFR